MFFLFIDTSQLEQIRLALYDEQKTLIKRSHCVGYHYSEKLITFIDRLIREVSKKKMSIKSVYDINGIFVVKGPGRFSALRTGITTANTLAWSLNIPVMNVTALGGNMAPKAIQSITQKEFSKAIIPEYGKEPNISKQSNKGV